MPTITDLCEQLADAFEAKGVRVRENLQPGLTYEEILKAAAPLPMPLPDEVIELYQWRNGTADENDAHMRHLLFRDNQFISLERAAVEYRSMMDTYGVHSTLKSDRVDLRTCMPIGAFEGAWQVVACGAHRFGRSFDHPVIGVFQGIDMHFHSVRSMLQTCISWVSSPRWKALEGLPADEELDIWRRHNPGIFAEAGN